jgi:lipoyl(octanoyl) transferase
MPIWQITPEPVEYLDAVTVMESQVAAILDGSAGEKIWLLQHPPLYTAGTSAHAAELVAPNRFPVYTTGRGGRYTYHGPQQRIAYVMLDLRMRGRDVRAFVFQLEEWVIKTLSHFDLIAERREGRIGLWVNHDDKEMKIAAIGVRIRKWITYHGVSINLNPDLSHFSGIVPCGLSDFGVTSLHALGKNISMDELDTALQKTWDQVFSIC